MKETGFSDHFAVLGAILNSQCTTKFKLITSRKIKNLDIKSFKNSLSSLKNYSDDSLDSMVKSYKEEIRAQMEKE